MEEVTTKTCKQCNIEKPITDFHTDKRSRDGHGVICKQCIKENLNSKKKKQMELTKVRGFYPELAGFTPGQLIKELEYRGYYGELKVSQIIKLTPKN
jgi:hypothetical protein